MMSLPSPPARTSAPLLVRSSSLPSPPATLIGTFTSSASKRSLPAPRSTAKLESGGTVEPVRDGCAGRAVVRQAAADAGDEVARALVLDGDVVDVRAFAADRDDPRLDAAVQDRAGCPSREQREGEGGDSEETGGDAHAPILSESTRQVQLGADAGGRTIQARPSCACRSVCTGIPFPTSRLALQACTASLASASRTIKRMSTGLGRDTGRARDSNLELSDLCANLLTNH